MIWLKTEDTAVDR